MKIEKTPRGYLLSANGGNRIEFYREFNGVEAWACAAFDELMNERDTLRAKLAEMEQQEPVAAQQRFQRQQEMMAVWLPWQTTELRKGRPARTVDVLGLNDEYR